MGEVEEVGACVHVAVLSACAGSEGAPLVLLFVLLSCCWRGTGERRGPVCLWSDSRMAFRDSMEICNVPDRRLRFRVLRDSCLVSACTGEGDGDGDGDAGAMVAATEEELVVTVASTEYVSLETEREGDTGAAGEADLDRGEFGSERATDIDTRRGRRAPRGRRTYGSAESSGAAASSSSPRTSLDSRAMSHCASSSLSCVWWGRMLMLMRSLLALGGRLPMRSWRDGRASTCCRESAVCRRRPSSRLPPAAAALGLHAAAIAFSPASASASVVVAAVERS